jgi:hypothetical protein
MKHEIEDEDGSEESEDDSDESDESDNDSDNDADDEEALVDEVLESYCGPSVAKQVRKYIEDMYSTRYEEPRDKPVPSSSGPNAPCSQDPQSREAGPLSGNPSRHTLYI